MNLDTAIKTATAEHDIRVKMLAGETPAATDQRRATRNVATYTANLLDSLERSANMAKIGKMTRASHGAMIAAQVAIAAQVLGQLQAIYDMMDEQ